MFILPSWNSKGTVNLGMLLEIYGALWAMPDDLKSLTPSTFEHNGVDLIANLICSKPLSDVVAVLHC